MNPLLNQFLSEARDFLQGIGEKLMQLEDAPANQDLIHELFRLVHTLKGNSCLFDFPSMTRVLHAGEDLMDAIRNGRLAYSRDLADRLLDAMDFVGQLCDEIKETGGLGSDQSEASARLAQDLRQQIPARDPAPEPLAADAAPRPAVPALALGEIPEAARMEAYRQGGSANAFLVHYLPAEGCFFQGEDPFHQARQTPAFLWGGLRAREPWPSLELLDAYRCVLAFQVLTTASREELLEHFRYVPEQVQLVPLPLLALVLPMGDPNGGPVYEDFVSDALGYLDAGDLAALGKSAQALLELSNPDLWLSSALRWLLVVLEREPDNGAALRQVIESLKSLEAPAWQEFQAPAAATQVEPCPLPDPALAEKAEALIAIQRTILALDDDTPWLRGRIQAAAATLAACLRALGKAGAPGTMAEALADAMAANHGGPLLSWLDRLEQPAEGGNAATPLAIPDEAPRPAPEASPERLNPVPAPLGEGEVRFGRRAEDASASGKSLKVDQAKIDRLMNLIGEMVVSKNALPYLAGRAETVYGSREFSREIKAQYAVINRIAEEMQDAIMQVCMMPVSFVFQRFTRLVRDTSRKLGKEVNLVLQGEDTEADKNIIEALGDPLVHIIRNSLDHGFEQPEVRRAAGKAAAGTLTIRASQESDRVLIEIIDDGRGIDPDVIKRKAYETGVIDEATLARISDPEAVNLIFAPGLSTAREVSDLSGRGVGMDVVRTAVEKVNGSIHLESVLGQGTRITLSLPLSMAVTNVMIIEAHGQVFGVPMDNVIETVRIPQARIRTIKKAQATVLRGRIVALKTLNALLGISTAAKANADGEAAVLVVRLGDEPVGLIVDNFRETVSVILKPMTGVLAGLSAYSGSALMGDGSVLMVLNIKEIF